MGTFLYYLIKKTAEAANLLKNGKQKWAFSHTNILSYFPKGLKVSPSVEIFFFLFEFKMKV